MKDESKIQNVAEELRQKAICDFVKDGLTAEEARLLIKDIDFRMIAANILAQK